MTRLFRISQFGKLEHALQFASASVCLRLTMRVSWGLFGLRVMSLESYNTKDGNMVGRGNQPGACLEELTCRTQSGTKGS